MISLAATTLPAFSDPYPNDYGYCGNRKRSQKLGQYLRDVSIEPSNFMWRKHKVEIYESWLERTRAGTYFAVFRLKVDGKYNSLPFKEKNTLIFLEFEPEPKSQNVYDAGRNRSVRWYTYLFAKDGPWSHWVRFNSKPIDEVIQLRVFTRSLPLNNLRMISEPTETVLTLKVSGT